MKIKNIEAVSNKRGGLFNISYSMNNLLFATYHFLFAS